MGIKFSRTQKVEEILDIVKKLGDFFDEDSYDDLEEEVFDDETFAAFDEDTGKMLGFIIFCELNKQALELTWLAVDKKCQGQGIGRRLIDFGLEKLKAREKYKVLYCKTIGEGDRQRSFAATRAFYERLGFIPLESIKPYPGWHKSKYVQTFVKCLLHS